MEEAAFEIGLRKRWSLAFPCVGQGTWSECPCTVEIFTTPEMASTDHVSGDPTLDL